MHFVIHALDRPDSSDTRALARDAHLEYIREFDVVLGGPLLDERGAMCGSLIVVDLPDKAAVEALVAEDPYTAADLFGHVTITGFRPVVGHQAA